MATQRSSDPYERSAAGLDFDENDPIRSNAASIGAKMVQEGPDALFQELENLLPEAWQEHIRAFPLAAVVLGVGVGVWLGLKKSDEVISAGSALVSSAAMANVSQVMDKINKG
jgi:hypothetical protein